MMPPTPDHGPTLLPLNNFMDTLALNFVQLLFANVHPSLHQSACQHFYQRVDVHHQQACASIHQAAQALGEASDDTGILQ